jgi:ubiquinone/menaquinone biosynthesis C-methylase UbiE
MTLSPHDWHARFVQQANWTHDLRRHLYPRVRLEQAQRILEVGCGTGAILAELITETRGNVFGLDIDPGYLNLSITNAPLILPTCGDAHLLPYAPGAFDMTLCHFLLLWVDHPSQVLLEMARVTRPGGAVLALAEPDYGGRIDYPPTLEELGEWQTEGLRRQGADPLMGRQLAGLFTQVGFDEVETGVLGGQWQRPPTKEAWESEWAMLETDLQESPEMIKKYRDIDAEAWARGERVLFVPTFYAVGWKT